MFVDEWQEEDEKTNCATRMGDRRRRTVQIENSGSATRGTGEYKVRDEGGREKETENTDGALGTGDKRRRRTHTQLSEWARR